MERYRNNIQDQFGNAISNVTVTVRLESSGALATIYSDNSLSAKSNPFTNELDGEFFFYALDDRYDIFFTGPITDQIDDVLLQDTGAFGPVFRILADINTATPPTTETPTVTYEIWDLANNDRLMSLGFAINNNVRLRNLMEGGDINLKATQTGGGLVTLFLGDPDGTTFLRAATDLELQVGSGGETAFRATANGASAMYHNNIDRCGTLSGGIFYMKSDGNLDTESRYIVLRHQDGTHRARIGYLGNSELLFKNLIHGATVKIALEDAGGFTRNVLDADPDGTTVLRADSNLHLEVAAGETAILCTANAGVALYHDNVERFRTVNEDVLATGTGAEVRHADESFYPVGMNTAPELATLDSGNLSLARDNVAKMLTYNTGTARQLAFPDDSNIPLGQLWALLVGPSAGVLTGDGETGVQIRYWNGTGWTTTAAAGNITIGIGQYTIWKETDTLYWISGPTLS